MKKIVVLHYANIRRPNWLLIKEAARLRNIKLLSWEPEKVQFYCDDKKNYPLYNGKVVNPTLLLHRTIIPFLGILIPAFQHWKKTGTIVLNSLEHAVRSRDKLLTTLVLQEAKIPIVPTLGYIRSKDNDLSVLGRGEIISKPAHGLRGEGIEYFSSLDEAVIPKDIKKTISPLEHYIIQPFINTGGRDIRAFVVNNQCMGLMQRQAKNGEFRANLANGATAKPLPLNHPASTLAVVALKACKLDYGGVDMIEDKDGVIRVLEVDAWAGFAGLTEVTGADVAGAIIDMATSKI